MLKCRVQHLASSIFQHVYWDFHTSVITAVKILCILGGSASLIWRRALRSVKVGHVYCMVRTESLNSFHIIRSFKGLSAGLAAFGQLSRLRRVEEQRFPDVSAELPFLIVWTNLGNARALIFIRQFEGCGMPGSRIAPDLLSMSENIMFAGSSNQVLIVRINKRIGFRHVCVRAIYRVASPYSMVEVPPSPYVNCFDWILLQAGSPRKVW